MTTKTKRTKFIATATGVTKVEEAQDVLSALTPTATFSEPSDPYVRTALIIAGEGKQTDSESGSVDVVIRLKDGTLRRLAQINFSYINEGSEEILITDVIDVDKQFSTRAALTFNNGTRNHVPAGQLVSADFRRKVKS